MQARPPPTSLAASREHTSPSPLARERHPKPVGVQLYPPCALSRDPGRGRREAPRRKQNVRLPRSQPIGASRRARSEKRSRGCALDLRPSRHSGQGEEVTRRRKSPRKWQARPPPTFLTSSR